MTAKLGTPLEEMIPAQGWPKMMTFPFFASGDATLFLMLGGILLLLGATVGLGIAGVVLVAGKSPDKKKLGRRFLACAAIPIALAGGWWIAVVGFD